MNLRERDGIYAAFATVLVLLLSAEACPKEIPPENGDFPVTAERLTGARLEYHRADPKLVWSFTEEAFVLEIGGETVPRELIETLTGKRAAVARIEGTWTLNEEDNVLNLSTTQADGKAMRRNARLSVFAAGMVRVNLGDYQYNVFSAAELAEPDPKPVFEQVGEDLAVAMTERSRTRRTSSGLMPVWSRITTRTWKIHVDRRHSRGSNCRTMSSRARTTGFCFTCDTES